MLYRYVSEWYASLLTLEFSKVYQETWTGPIVSARYHTLWPYLELRSCFGRIFDHKRRDSDAEAYEIPSFFFSFFALFYPWRLFRFSPSPALSLLHVGAPSGFHRVDSFVSCHSLRFYSRRPHGFSPCPSVYALFILIFECEALCKERPMLPSRALSTDWY